MTYSQRCGAKKKQPLTLPRDNLEVNDGGKADSTGPAIGAERLQDASGDGGSGTKSWQARVLVIEFICTKYSEPAPATITLCYLPLLSVGLGGYELQNSSAYMATRARFRAAYVFTILKASAKRHTVEHVHLPNPKLAGKRLQYYLRATLETYRSSIYASSAFELGLVL